MSDLPTRLLKQVQTTFLTLRAPAAWLPVAIGFVALVIALLIVPGTEPSVWNWLGLLLIGALTGYALIAMVQRMLPRASATERQDLGLLAIAALVLATALNLFTTLAGTATLLIGTCLIAAIALRTGRRKHPALILCGAIIVLVPMWVWLSLDASNAGLMLLIPLALLAWFADGHMRAALRADTTESVTGARSYRFLSWLSLLAAAILTTVLAVSGDVNNAWAVIGAVGVLVCIGIDVGLPEHASLPGKWSRQLIAAGFVWLGICWLTSL